MAGLQDSNVTVDLADSAVWDPGNHSNTSSALLSRPICLTMPLTSPAPQDFPGCQDGGNPYLAACYVRKMYHDVFLKYGTYLFSLHPAAILNFWGKIAILPFASGKLTTIPLVCLWVLTGNHRSKHRLMILPWPLQRSLPIIPSMVDAPIMTR